MELLMKLWGDGEAVESGCTTCGYYSSICTVLVPDILLISLLVQREVSSVLVSEAAKK